MLMRSGFFTRPRPLVEFDCGSQSTSSVLTSAAASEAARLMAVVVLPTPPFWFATAMTRPMILLFVLLRAGYANAFRKSMPDSCATWEECFTWNTPTRARLPRPRKGTVDLSNCEVFHVKHIRGTESMGRLGLQTYPGVFRVKHFYDRVRLIMR